MTINTITVNEIVEAATLSEMLYQAVCQTNKLEEYDRPAVKRHSIEHEPEGKTLMEGKVEIMMQKQGWAGAFYHGFQEVEFEVNRGGTSTEGMIGDRDFIFDMLEVHLELDKHEAEMPEPTITQD